MICPKCGSHNVSFKRERQGELKTKKKSTDNNEYYGNLSELWKYLGS